MSEYVSRLYKREQSIENLFKNKPRELLGKIAPDIKLIPEEFQGAIVEEKKFSSAGGDVHEFDIYNGKKLLQIYVSFGMGRKHRERISSCRIEVGASGLVEQYDYYPLRPEQLAIDRKNVMLYELVLDKLENFLETTT